MGAVEFTLLHDEQSFQPVQHEGIKWIADRFKTEIEQLWNLADLQKLLLYEWLCLFSTDDFYDP